MSSKDRRGCGQRCRATNAGNVMSSRNRLEGGGGCVVGLQIGGQKGSSKGVEAAVSAK